MRLTLRTLLAYLDNTLDPNDAEALRQKLSESAFATQLVQRIRSTLVDPTLSAPSPDAVSPVDEANVISEYLDSTLSAEQIAEVEKACLESDSHLAEAAACHQILTMVLGKPADVSEALRDRIYQLPDRSIEDIPTAPSGSFSGVTVPPMDELPGPADSPGALPPADSVLQSSAGPITPVGAADSGVSDAPKRLQKAAAENEPDSLRRARVAAEDMYGRSIRPSRITPWLVSLALAGVFLFVLSRVLAPLLNGSGNADEERIAKLETSTKIDNPPAETFDPSEETELESAGDDAELIVVPAEKAPVMETVGTPGIEIKSSDEIEATELPMPVASAAPEANKSDPEILSDAGTEGEAKMSPLAVVDPASVDPASVDAAAVDAAAVDPAGEDVSAMPEPADVAASEEDLPMPGKDDASSDSVDGKPSDADKLVDAVAVAKAISDDTILLAASTTGEMILTDAKLTRVVKDMAVSQRAALVNAPKFRSELVINTAASVVLVDATRASFITAQSDAQTDGLSIDYGKVIVKSKQDDVRMPLEIAGRTLELYLPSIDTTAAVEVRWLRRAGFDPFKPENRIPVARIVAIADKDGLAGEIGLVTDAGDIGLNANQQWLARGDDAGSVLDLTEPVKWVTKKDTKDSILDQSAREGLLNLIDQQQPLLVSLREATSFRRAEVAGLAAQLMLQLGHWDVYFGTDGILSQPKQRAYWTEHYRTLRGSMDRSGENATMLSEQIGQMDAANGKSLMRLLVGFSQSQLVEGADDDLIEMLDSNSMAVRVLATENLREITGTTLNFWAGEDNAVRRVPTIKKWQARLRKGDVRWKPEG
jgi:hypothetical protein